MLEGAKQPFSPLPGDRTVDRGDFPDGAGKDSQAQVHLSSIVREPGASPEIHHLSIGKGAEVAQGIEWDEEQFRISEPECQKGMSHTPPEMVK